MIETTHLTQPSVLRRFVAFPLTLLVFEAAVLFALAIGYSAAAHRLGVMDKGPIEFVGAVLLAGLIIGLWKLLHRWLERTEDREFACAGATLELGTGLALGFALFSMATGTVALLGGFEVLGLRGVGALWSMLSMAVFSGVFEETLFRGVLFRHIETMLGTWAALAVTSTLFGAAHLANPGATPFAALAIATEAGILLGAAYLLARRLWLAVGIHAAWNFAQGWVFSVPVSGGKAPLGLLITRRIGPDWLTGGTFGLEASVPALVVATTAGLVLLVIAARKGRIQPPMWRRDRAITS